MIIEQAQNWIVTYTNENKDTRYSHSHLVDHEPEFNNPEKRVIFKGAQILSVSKKISQIFLKIAL